MTSPRRHRSSTAAAKVTPVRLGTLDDVGPEVLQPGAELEGMRVAAAAGDLVDLGAARVDESELLSVVAQEVDLRSARLADVVVRLDSPVVRLNRGRWRGVEVTGRLGSVDATEVEWRGVHLVGCRIGYLNLRGAELLDVVLTDCTIDDIDLVGATARRLALSNTTVRQLVVHESRLTDVDLRQGEVESFQGLRHLAGVTISSHQLALLAPALADELGLRVED